MSLVYKICCTFFQAKLAEDAKFCLDQVAKAIKAVHKLCLEHGTPPVFVSIEGHTNCKHPERRSNKYNMRLSEKRAAACRKYVESAGAIF